MSLIRKLRLLFVGAIVALGVTAVPAVAFADEVAPVVTEDVGSNFVIASPVWSIIVGVLLPFVVGLITKASASDRFQAVVGIVVAAVGAIVVRATTVDGAGVLDKALFLDVFLVYGPQLLMYLGVYKKFEINSKLAPNSGLG